jgi:hypothetical protein
MTPGSPVCERGCEGWLRRAAPRLRHQRLRELLEVAPHWQPLVAVNEASTKNKPVQIELEFL